MGAAEIISFEEVRARKQWDALRQELHTRFDEWLDRLEIQLPGAAPTLAQVTETVWNLRQALTGGLTETIVEQTHRGEYTRQQTHCAKCGRLLTAHAHVSRTVETMVGAVQLERPYFYCRACREGVYPSTTRWVWWQGVNSSTCNTPRRRWSPKYPMTQLRRSLVS